MWQLLVDKGVVQPQDPGVATTFLRSRPGGVYTTTKTVDGARCLLLWERHLARLSQSLHLLRADVNLNADAMRRLVNPSLLAGLERAFEKRDDEEELVVTVFACTSDQELVDVSVHIASFVPAPVLPAEVAVMGPSRRAPLVKASLWVSTRHVLEQRKPVNTAEAILCNDGEHLLEGLVTNFFVVLASSSDSMFIVQTAALENGVLPGTIRQLILEICAEKNIPVIEAAPTWSARHAWTEAFVTSSVRLVQPVRTIRMPGPWNVDFNPEEWSRSNWNPLHLQSPGPLTQMLQEAVLERAKRLGWLINTRRGASA